MNRDRDVMKRTFKLMRTKIYLVGLLCFLQLLAVSSGAEALDFLPDETRVYKRIGDMDLKVDFFNPEGHKASDKSSGIVFFFSGGWAQGHRSQYHALCDYFSKRGMVSMTADYRIMKRDGTTPAECLKDAKSVMRWIRKNATALGIDPNKVVAGGGSAGGHLAAALGSCEGFDEEGEDTTVSCVPNALVLHNPVYFNGEGGFGHRKVRDYWEAFSPYHNIKESTPPTIVFFGSADKHMKNGIPKEYHSKMLALGIPSELIIYDGLGHGFYNFTREEDGFRNTTLEADRFLAELGFLKGKPREELLPICTDAYRKEADRLERERRALYPGNSRKDSVKRSDR